MSSAPFVSGSAQAAVGAPCPFWERELRAAVYCRLTPLLFFSAGFRKWLLEVARYLPGALHQAGGLASVVEAYTALPKSKGCPSASKLRSGHAYSPGRHGPVINLGEGTTGTRFLSCVFQRLGFRTSHNELISNANDYSSLSEYDYISDNPMNMQGAHILATRHGGQIPGVILSLRDPREWARSRLAHHQGGGAQHWRPASECLGYGGPLTELDRMPLAVMTYNAFSACIATSPDLRYGDDHLLLINVFQTGRSEDDVDTELGRNLSRFLLGRNRTRFLLAKDRGNSRITRESLSEASVLAGVRGCAHMTRNMSRHSKFAV